MTGNCGNCGKPKSQHFDFRGTFFCPTIVPVIKMLSHSKLREQLSKLKEE